MSFSSCETITVAKKASTAEREMSFSSCETITVAKKASTAEVRYDPDTTTDTHIIVVCVGVTVPWVLRYKKIPTPQIPKPTSHLSSSIFEVAGRKFQISDHVGVFLYQVGKPIEVYETMVSFRFECSKALRGSNKEMTQIFDCPSSEKKEGIAVELHGYGVEQFGLRKDLFPELHQAYQASLPPAPASSSSSSSSTTDSSISSSSSTSSCSTTDSSTSTTSSSTNDVFMSESSTTEASTTTSSSTGSSSTSSSSSSSTSSSSSSTNDVHMSDSSGTTTTTSSSSSSTTTNDSSSTTTTATATKKEKESGGPVKYTVKMIPDNDALLYAVVLGYLVPHSRDAAAFSDRIMHLFGPEYKASDMQAEIVEWMKKDCSADEQHALKIWSALPAFRNRLVNFLAIEQDLESRIAAKYGGESHTHLENLRRGCLALGDLEIEALARYIQQPIAITMNDWDSVQQVFVRRGTTRFGKEHGSHPITVIASPHIDFSSTNYVAELCPSGSIYGNDEECLVIRLFMKVHEFKEAVCVMRNKPNKSTQPRGFEFTADQLIEMGVDSDFQLEALGVRPPDPRDEAAAEAEAQRDRTTTPKKAMTDVGEKNEKKEQEEKQNTTQQQTTTLQREFPCHLHRLVEASPIFARALNDDSRYAEKNTRILELYFSPPTVEALLCFIYTSNIPPEIRNKWVELVELSDAAAMLQMPELLELSTHLLAIQLLNLAASTTEGITTIPHLFLCFRQALNLLTQFSTPEEEKKDKKQDHDSSSSSSASSSSTSSSSSSAGTTSMNDDVTPPQTSATPPSSSSETTASTSSSMTSSASESSTSVGTTKTAADISLKSTPMAKLRQAVIHVWSLLQHKPKKEDQGDASLHSSSSSSSASSIESGHIGTISSSSSSSRPFSASHARLSLSKTKK